LPVVKAGPNQFLLVGGKGMLENRGSAVQVWLRPGTVFVLVPSTKQEAGFELTQETKDGIPLRFKGIIHFRITDPLPAARLFDFSGGAGVAQMTALLTHIAMGELRHAVSSMTMGECIEQRKTTLSGVVDAAMQATVLGGDDRADAAAWGVTVEVARVAQVFIVDAALRGQLEAEVRDAIRLQSDQSGIRAREETRLAEMASEGRVDERTAATNKERVRREEELELAGIARHRRMLAEALATDRQTLGHDLERFHAEIEAQQDRLATEAPVRLARATAEIEVLRAELEMRALENQLKALDVERELLLPRARQDLRREILPLEQAPRVVEAASRVLQGTNLSLYGDNALLVGQVAPLLEILTGAARRAMHEMGHAPD